MSISDMAKTIFESLTNGSPRLVEELLHVPHDQLLAAIDKSYDPESVAVQENIFRVCKDVLGDSAEPWLRESRHLAVQNFAFGAYCSALNACIPDGGFEIATCKLRNEQAHQLAYFAHDLLEFDDRSKIIDWIEKTLVSNGLSVKTEWGQLAALAGIPWRTITRWLSHGKPLNLVALDAIVAWLTGSVDFRRAWLNRLTPMVIDAPERSEIRRRVVDHAEREATPRIEKTAGKIVNLL